MSIDKERQHHGAGFCLVVVIAIVFCVLIITAGCLL